VHHHQLVSVTFVGLLRDFDSAALILIFLLLVDDFNTVEELAYAGNMADKAR
jgi:hypothetical protein